jgi:hypothetical protein
MTARDLDSVLSSVNRFVEPQADFRGRRQPFPFSSTDQWLTARRLGAPLATSVVPPTSRIPAVYLGGVGFWAGELPGLVAGAELTDGVGDTTGATGRTD